MPQDHEYYIVHSQRVWRPPTDVYETGDAVVVKVEVPGMREEDFGISIDGRTLQISGIRPDPDRRVGYHNMEIQYGAFRSSVRLGRGFETDGINARYDNGFLYVELPKTKARRVQVNLIDDVQDAH